MCINDIRFPFNNLLYRQIDESAIGSLLGLILADFFMRNPEQIVAKSVINDASLYVKYVDDTFCGL